MEAATLRELQDQKVNLQTQMRLKHRVRQQTGNALEQAPLSEIVNTTASTLSWLWVRRC